MWGEKKTKIVATLSDFRANEEFVRGLFEAGMDVVRINSAHVTEEGAAKIVEAVRRVNPAIPVILDTKGPEIRVTAVADEYGGAIGFQTGERVKVRGTADGEPSTRDTIYFNVATVVRDIAVGARLLIADGELELRVTDKTDEELMCEFVRGGTLRSRKSVNVPGMKIDLPSVTEKDRRFIEWAVKNDVDFIAHSFVRSAGDVHAVQEILDRYDSPIKIISKIENQQGIDNLDEIVEASYGVMVARGDLGVELPAEAIPNAQRRIVERCIAAKRPVIGAADALFDGALAPSDSGRGERRGQCHLRARGCRDVERRNGYGRLSGGGREYDVARGPRDREGRNAFYADDRYEHGFREPRDHGAVGAFGGAGQYELADSLCGARYRDRTHGPLSGRFPGPVSGPGGLLYPSCAAYSGSFVRRRADPA